MTPAVAFALRNWRLILGGLVLAGVGVALILARADARHWQKKALACEQRIDVAQREAAEQAARNAAQAAKASERNAERLAAVQPLIVRSTDVVRTYAQTSAGAASCLAPDRVQGIDQLDASLADPAPAGGGAGAVHADAGAPPG